MAGTEALVDEELRASPGQYRRATTVGCGGTRGPVRGRTNLFEINPEYLGKQLQFRRLGVPEHQYAEPGARPQELRGRRERHGHGLLCCQLFQCRRSRGLSTRALFEIMNSPSFDVSTCLRMGKWELLCEMLSWSCSSSGVCKCGLMTPQARQCHPIALLVSLHAALAIGHINLGCKISQLHAWSLNRLPFTLNRPTLRGSAVVRRRLDS